VSLRALDPDGQRPVVTVSMAAHLDPARHLDLGRALAPLRDEGVAIVTSGGLTHNQEAFRQGWFAGSPVDAAQAPSARFADHALAALAATGPERDRRLLDAPAHPDFAWAHPTLDHWLPALIAAGAADRDPGVAWYQGFQHSLSTAMVVFGSGG
jgi:aromatic ring-opening dioxygenase catalytic subunit (LigB family)